MLTQAQTEALEALAAHDNNVSAAARSINISRASFRERLNAAKSKQIDPAIQAGMEAVGTGIVPSVTWAKTKNPDGTSYSVLLRTPPVDNAQAIADATETALERIAQASPTAPTLIRPKAPDGQLYGFLGLFDAHIGLSMPGYGLDEAVRRLVDAAFEALDSMPSSGTIAIINGGDFTHQNDDSNQTPNGKHPLPISGTYIDATDAGTDARIAIIERAASKFDRVITKDLKGNHDPVTAQILRASLRQRYREHDRISVDLDGIEFWHTVFGANLITAQHGDIKRSAKDIALGLCQKYRPERGVTRYHEHHTGHLHHVKETRLDVGGVHLCQHAAIAPKSNHDVSNLYFGDSILQAITYKASGGRKSTMEIHLD